MHMNNKIKIIFVSLFVSNFIIIQKHVGDSIGNGVLSPTLHTPQFSLHNIDLLFCFVLFCF